MNLELRKFDITQIKDDTKKVVKNCLQELQLL